MSYESTEVVGGGASDNAVSGLVYFGGGGDAAVKLVVFIGFFAFVWSKAAANKRKRLKEMDDGGSEGWTSCAMQENEMMPVLVNGLVVYETKEIASRLEATNILKELEG